MVNQTIIKTNDTVARPVTTAEDLKDMLKYSKHYKNVYTVRELARGGESVVFRITHSNLDETVVKCPLFKD